MGLFRLSTRQQASPDRLPLTIFTEFSPHIGFSFPSPYANFICCQLLFALELFDLTSNEEFKCHLSFPCTAVFVFMV